MDSGTISKVGASRKPMVVLVYPGPVKEQERVFFLEY